MPVDGFDHYNLRAARPVLDELKAFYCDVVGLTVGERPPFRRFGYWLYVGERPVLHLSEADDAETRSRTAVTTFAHAAFNCTGRAEFERRLRAHGIAYRTGSVPLLELAQLFFQDPAGNGVELQFAASEPAAPSIVTTNTEALKMDRRAAVAIVTSAVAGALLCPRAGAAQLAAVRVRREQPIVRRTVFDPRYPPRDMPPLTPPESGVCKTTFELAASVMYSAERLSGTTARVYVDELDIVTRLSFDIYTVANAPAKLLAHEEAHRAIGEHFYKDAARIAEEIGRRLVGTTFDGRGSTEQAAQQDGFDKVVAAIERDYMARVRIPSAAANERFDEITNHGLNPIDEAEAIALTLTAANTTP